MNSVLICNVLLGLCTIIKIDDDLLIQQRALGPQETFIISPKVQFAVLGPWQNPPKSIHSADSSVQTRGK